jgi:hypothetical protein
MNHPPCSFVFLTVSNLPLFPKDKRRRPDHGSETRGGFKAKLF